MRPAHKVKGAPADDALRLRWCYPRRVIYALSKLREISTPGGVVTADAEWWKTQAAPAAGDVVDLQGVLGSSTQAVIGIVWYGYLAGGGVNTAEGTATLTLRPIEQCPIEGVTAHTRAILAGATQALAHGIEWQIPVGYKRKLTVHTAAGNLHANTVLVRFFWRRIS